MELIFVFLVMIYLVPAACLFLGWVYLISQDFNLSISEDGIVLRDVLMAALLWPLVFPIAEVHFYE